MTSFNVSMYQSGGDRSLGVTPAVFTQYGPDTSTCKYRPLIPIYSRCSRKYGTTRDISRSSLAAESLVIHMFGGGRW